MKQRDKPREQALIILRRTEQGAFADALLDRSRKDFDTRDARFIMELVYGVLRNRTRLDWILDHFSAHPLIKTDVWTRNILRLAAYQMLFLDKVPASAAVNTAVELAKEYGKKGGYVNALLRNLDRRRSIPKTIPGDVTKKLSILYSHPEWLVTRWVNRFGPQTTGTVLRRNNTPSPLVVRTNTLKTTREELKASFKEESVESAETRYSPLGLEILSFPGTFRSLSAYRKGWFTIQDEAAQLISMMLNPAPDDEVLDACAAPGGKAAHLAELMKNRGRLVALEKDPDRMARIEENRERLGTSIVAPVLGDAAKYKESGFDKILIDAPCSGLGVLRRHPDGRWRKNENIIPELADIQRRILDNCASLLKPSGILVYATCTTEPEENENIINRFLDRASGAFSVDDPRPFLPEEARKLVDDNGFFKTFPNEPEMDGFFGVRIVKK